MSYLEIQGKLKTAGFNPGPLDGKWGDQSTAALDLALAYAVKAKKAEPPAEPGDHGLKDPAAFFAVLRQTSPFGPSLSEQEVAGVNRLLKACEGLPPSQTAYIVATGFHETAGTMTPIREYGRGAGKPYGKPGRNNGQIPYGRGDVQLTWDDNYEWADAALGLGGYLLANYDRALEPEISAQIIVAGMIGGHFNGKQKKGLAHYLPNATGTHEQFKAARYTVNIQDKADLIAGYATNVQKALIAGGWH